jgi:hypothetical protein
MNANHLSPVESFINEPAKWQQHRDNLDELLQDLSSVLGSSVQPVRHFLLLQRFKELQ